MASTRRSRATRQVVAGVLAALTTCSALGAWSPSVGAATTTTTATSTTTDGSTTTTTPECAGGPPLATVRPLAVAPGQPVSITSPLLWLSTAPSPDPSLCPLPVGLDGQVDIVLRLGSVNDPQAVGISLGRFPVTHGVLDATITIPRDITYRGTANLAVVVVGVEPDFAIVVDPSIAIIDPPGAPSGTGTSPLPAAQPVAATPALTG